MLQRLLDFLNLEIMEKNDQRTQLQLQKQFNSSDPSKAQSLITRREVIS